MDDRGRKARLLGNVELLLAKLREVLEGRVRAAFLFGGRAKGYVLRGGCGCGRLLRKALRPV